MTFLNPQSNVGIISANRLCMQSITCYAQQPPLVTEDVFEEVSNSPIVYVPANCLDAYKMHEIWGLYDVQPLGAIIVETEEIIFTPQEYTVEIVWPANADASTYEIVITKDGEVICTLIFNADGQLTGIAFAPARHGNSRAPEQTGQTGFSFTITNLNPGTAYNYTLTVKDSSDNVLETKTGTFTTEGISTASENILSTHGNSKPMATPSPTHVSRANIGGHPSPHYQSAESALPLNEFCSLAYFLYFCKLKKKVHSSNH